MLTGVSVSNLANTGLLHQEFSQLQSTSVVQYAGSWSCEVLLQVHCSDLLTRPPSSESHPLVSQSTRTETSDPSAEPPSLQNFCLLDSFDMPFATLFASPQWLPSASREECISAVLPFQLPGRLPSKPTGPAGARKGESGSSIHRGRDTVRTWRLCWTALVTLMRAQLIY